MNNLSTYSNDATANTCLSCAQQRAFNLATYGVRSAIELCIGPSFRVLRECYKEYGIDLTGNDIDPRWQKYCSGKWIIGDAGKINCSEFDAVIVAPPLSKNCSGKREDSLSVDEIFPQYTNFLNLNNRIVVFVLPGRTLSLKSDRKELYRFLSKLNGRAEIIPLINKVVKYVDIYWEKN